MWGEQQMVPQQEGRNLRFSITNKADVDYLYGVIRSNGEGVLRKCTLFAEGHDGATAVTELSINPRARRLLVDDSRPKPTGSIRLELYGVFSRITPAEDGFELTFDDDTPQRLLKRLEPVKDRLLESA